MQERIHKILRDECAIPDHSRVVVAVSGGPDSICLFHLILGLPYLSTIAHFDHQLRPESGEELKFVKAIAESKGIPFYSQPLNVREFAISENMGIEEAARKARYEFLFHVAAETESQAVITAHHADDQVETILMNFIRGAGLKGLAGMSCCQHTIFSEKIRLIRPLLDFKKEEILAYCRDNNLQFLIDESNYELVYFRNRIRNQLIPLLSEYNPNFIETVLRNQKALAVDLQNILDQTDSALKSLDVFQKEGVISFSIEKFTPLPDAVKNYVLKDLIQRLDPDWIDISLDLIKAAKDVLAKGYRTQHQLLEKGIYLLVEGGEGIITCDPQLVWKDHWPTIHEKISTPISETIFDLDKKWIMELSITTREKINGDYLNNSDPMSAYVDRAQLKDEILIRCWQPGDVFHPLGMGGKSIKLSDFWINHKIPIRAKEKWPVFEAQGEIIWIPGFQPSHHFRITESTREVLVFRITKRI
jgi:tRNA(Ile)-lysidine synthase